MGKSQKPTATVRRAFQFSFREHSAIDHGQCNSKEAYEQALFQAMQNQNWTELELRRPTDIEWYIEPEVTTVDGLQALFLGTFAEEIPLQESVLRFPFDKLRAMLTATGWRFISGTFSIFESHHNDTEIRAVLEMSEDQAPAKKAPKPVAKKKPAKKAPTARKRKK